MIHSPTRSDLPTIGAQLTALAMALAVGCGTPPADRGETADPMAPTAQPTTRAQPTTTEQVASEENPLFIDLAAASGLDFTHWNGMSGELYYAEMMGSGAALFDYDNDGDLDVYLVQGNVLGPASTADKALFPLPGPLPLGDRLYRNDLSTTADGSPRLHFTDVTEDSGIEARGYGMGATAADFDNDGWIDLYVTNLNGNQMLRNLGNNPESPTFEDVTEASGSGSSQWSVPAVAFDYDRDGWLDLYIGHYVNYSPGANKRCTDELGVANYCGPLAFAPLPDLLLRNRGDGTFEDVSRQTEIDREYGGALGAVAADFDADGWLDLYVANDGLPNQLWMNRGAEGVAGFENRALLAGAAVSGQGHPEASMGVAAADFDRDGDEDLLLTHLSRETNTMYVNNGDGLFVDRSAATGLGAPSYSKTGFGAAWLDYDNDGWLDLLTVNGAVKVIKTLSLAGDPFPLHQTNQLFRNTGAGSGFEDVSHTAGAAFALSEVSRGAAVGDIDNDGDIDAVVSNNSGPVRLLVNQVGQDQAWVGLRLVDSAGRRDLFGALAGVIHADDTSLWRRIGTTASYASTSDPRLLFGLGDKPEPIARIVVHWPDGRSEQWNAEQVAVGSYTVLRQGSGTRSDRRAN